MATVEQCEHALHLLADRLSEFRDGRGDDGSTPDRTISCTVRDLDAVFAARLEHGRLTGIRRVGDNDRHGNGAPAQVRFDVAGDDLLGLVDGSLDVAAAWLTGRLKVKAGFGDLIRLRSFL